MKKNISTLDTNLSNGRAIINETQIEKDNLELNQKFSDQIQNEQKKKEIK